jgi:hypothetical protein
MLQQGLLHRQISCSPTGINDGRQYSDDAQQLE